MKIEKLDETTVKVLLSEADLAHFQITYEQMNYNDEHTREAILIIVRQIRHQTGLPVETVRLFIEAFPDERNGCILYVNLMESAEDSSQSNSAESLPLVQERKSFDTPIGLEFETIDILIDACISLLYEFGHLVTKSSLYLYNGRYRLLLYTYCKMEDKIIALSQEYGIYLGKGAILCALTKEHSKPLALENAIEIIVKYLA